MATAPTPFEAEAMPPAGPTGAGCARAPAPASPVAAAAGPRAGLPPRGPSAHGRRLSSLMLDDAFDALLPKCPSIDRFLLASAAGAPDAPPGTAAARGPSLGPGRLLLASGSSGWLSQLESLDLDFLGDGTPPPEQAGAAQALPPRQLSLGHPPRQQAGAEPGAESPEDGSMDREPRSPFARAEQQQAAASARAEQQQAETPPAGAGGLGPRPSRQPSAAALLMPEPPPLGELPEPPPLVTPPPAPSLAASLARLPSVEAAQAAQAQAHAAALQAQAHAYVVAAARSGSAQSPAALSQVAVLAPPSADPAVAAAVQQHYHAAALHVAQAAALQQAIVAQALALQQGQQLWQVAGVGGGGAGGSMGGAGGAYEVSQAALAQQQYPPHLVGHYSAQHTAAATAYAQQAAVCAAAAAAPFGAAAAAPDTPAAGGQQEQAAAAALWVCGGGGGGKVPFRGYSAASALLASPSYSQDDKMAEWRKEKAEMEALRNPELAAMCWEGAPNAGAPGPLLPGGGAACGPAPALAPPLAGLGLSQEEAAAYQHHQMLQYQQSVQAGQAQARVLGAPALRLSNAPVQLVVAPHTPSAPSADSAGAGR